MFSDTIVENSEIVKIDTTKLCRFRAESELLKNEEKVLIAEGAGGRICVCVVCSV